MRTAFAIPTKNRAETLQRTLDNYQVHMHSDMQLHVNDNGSTDNTPDILEAALIADSRLSTYWDPPGTHVKDGFLKVLYNAAETSDYVVLMSDEDEIDWTKWDDFNTWLENNHPTFASTQFDHSEGFYRGRPGGHISPTDWFASAFYCSGLVYNSKAIREAIDIIWPLVEHNHFVKIYAEAAVALAMYADSGPMLWAPHHVAKQREQLDTFIVMDDGSRYWKPENRRILSDDYDQVLHYLTLKLPENKHTWQAAHSDTLIQTWRG